MDTDTGLGFRRSNSRSTPTPYSDRLDERVERAALGIDVTVRPERPVLGRAVVLAVDPPAACDVEGKAGSDPTLAAE